MRLIIALILGVSICQSAYAGNMKASWYSVQSLKDEGTWAYSKGIQANGKRFDETAMTCAAGKQYKLGSRILVTNLANGKSIVVTVTDRIGKRFYNSRIDLSKGAFLRLDSLNKGIINVKIDKVS
jgi:rare lipoprotein A